MLYEVITLHGGDDVQPSVSHGQQYQVPGDEEIRLQKARDLLALFIRDPFPLRFRNHSADHRVPVV